MSEGKVIEELKERINGRVLAEDLVYEGEVIAPRNTLIGKELIKKIDELGIRKVKIRSPLTCALEKGVCRKCYGMDLSNHKEILLGEAVGVIAAQSIGEPGTQLTMRTFHTGGVATAAAVVSGVRAENSGKVAYRDVKILVNEENGDKIVVSQSAKLIIRNYDYEIPSGSILKVKEGQQVEIGETLVTFDPFHIPIIADQDGRIEYRELYVKENYDEKYDVTEFMAIKPVESGDINPRVVVFDAEGNTKGSYTIPFGAYLMVREGEEIKKGQIIAKIIKEGAGTKDITGGLPRVQELFEARNPKGKAMLTEIEGKVEVTGKKKKGMRVILVKSVSDSSDYKEYLVPVGERLVVTDGMLVKAGDKITEGAISPFDVLNIKRM